MRALLAVLALGALPLAARAEAAVDVPAPPAPAPPRPAPTDIVPPSILTDAQPSYPDDCVRDGVRGVVALDLDIDDQGQVVRAAIVDSPDARLSWSALGAATNLVAAPATTSDGTPIFVRVRYTITFQLDEQERERLLAADEARRLAEHRETAPINLKGRVLKAGERASVAGALVLVDGTELSAISDEDGFFEFRGVPEGRRTIHVEASGFLDADVDEDIAANVVLDINLFLVEKPGAQETIVYGRRTQTEVTKRVLTQKELVRVPGTFGDAIRVVQRLPGVQRAPFGLGAVLVRGGAPEDSTILIDGHLSRLLFHLGAGPSVVNSDLVERLEFYPGGQGARYGRAIAGAVDVVTRDPKMETFAGKASVNLLESGFLLEGPLLTDEATGKGVVGFYAAGRTSYVAEVLNIGDVITQLVDTNLNLLTLAPRYSDYQAKLLWKIGGGHALSLAAFGSMDDLDFALDASQLGPNAPSNVGISIDSHRLNPVYRYASPQRNVDGTPKLSFFASPVVEVNATENRFDLSQFRLDVLRGSLRAELELRPSADWGVRVGTDDTMARFTTTTDVPILLPDERFFPRPATSDAPRFSIEDTVLGTSYSFYVEGDVKLGLGGLGDLTVVAGGRADLWTYYDQVRTSFDPRLTLRFDTLHIATLKGSLGLYHQTSSPFELAKEFGNPDLPLERGVQGSFGSEVQLTRSLDLDAQVFFRTADDLADFVISPAAFFASGAARVQAIGHQRVYGTEILLRQRLDTVKDLVPGWGQAFGWVAYTLMRAEERSDAPVGVDGGRAYPWAPSQFDQTHILSIAASTQLPQWAWGIEVGAAVRYVTGNPVTLAQGGMFDADTSNYRRYSEAFRTSRLPAFFQLDMRIDKKWTFDTFALAAYLDLQNVTNQQNYEFFQYNYDFTEVQGFPGLPILPVFGVDASF